ERPMPCASAPLSRLPPGGALSREWHQCSRLRSARSLHPFKPSLESLNHYPLDLGIPFMGPEPKAADADLERARRSKSLFCRFISKMPLAYWFLIWRIAQSACAAENRSYPRVKPEGMLFGALL